MDVTYSSVVTTKQPPRKPHAENDLDVTYSCVVTKKQPVIEGKAENDLDLTYSSVITTKKAARQASIKGTYLDLTLNLVCAVKNTFLQF